MEKESVLNQIIEEKIVSILRFKDDSKILPAAMAILKGGIRVIEVSLNTPNALDHISELTELDDIITERVLSLLNRITERKRLSVSSANFSDLL